MRLVLSLFSLIISSIVCAQTQYVTCVDYLPAPGQFVNCLPQYEEGDTKQDMINKCTEYINNGSLTHLGTYGGYVVYSFDHPIQNKLGSDFLINGNAFYAASDPIYGSETIGGSIEPGIVFVGVGDSYESCTWYRLASSEYFTTEVHDFEIVYYKPTAESGPHTQFCSTYDDYIGWDCSWTENGEPHDSTGFHIKNSFHKQTYWPQWIDDEVLMFHGDKCKNNAIETSGKGTYWVQYRYAKDTYGYVDACPNSDDDALSPSANGINKYNTFDIDWAIDDNGYYVDLPEINFIKVVCGIFQYCGWLGETSTEIQSIKDLHLIEGYDEDPIIIERLENPNPPKGPTTLREPTIINPNSGAIYDLSGRRLTTQPHGLFCSDGKLKFFK